MPRVTNPFITRKPRTDPFFGNEGYSFEDSEHIVRDDDADTALASGRAA